MIDYENIGAAAIFVAFAARCNWQTLARLRIPASVFAPATLRREPKGKHMSFKNPNNDA